MRYASLCGLFIVMSTWWGSAVSAGTIEYAVVDIGPLPGDVRSYASDVSPNGRYVIGTSEPASGARHFFRYDLVTGTSQQIVHPGYLSFTKIARVNNDGIVAINGYNSTTGRQETFLWQNGSTSSPLIGYWPRALSTEYLGGNRDLSPNGAFLKELDGTNVSLPFGGYGLVADIAEDGTLVGVYTSAGGIHAYRYNVNTLAFEDLGTFGSVPSGGGTYAPPDLRAVTIGGYIAAQATNLASGEQISYVWDGQSRLPNGDPDLREIDRWSTTAPTYDGKYVADVNSSGLAVGYADSPVEGNAFRWDYNSQTIKNLNELINPSLGWKLISASSIGDNGTIVGYGKIDNGPDRAFALTPIVVPEPNSMVMLGIGALSLILFRRRRGQ